MCRTSLGARSCQTTWRTHNYFRIGHHRELQVQVSASRIVRHSQNRADNRLENDFSIKLIIVTGSMCTIVNDVS